MRYNLNPGDVEISVFSAAQGCTNGDAISEAAWFVSNII